MGWMGGGKTSEGVLGLTMSMAVATPTVTATVVTAEGRPTAKCRIQGRHYNLLVTC